MFLADVNAAGVLTYVGQATNLRTRCGDYVTANGVAAHNHIAARFNTALQAGLSIWYCFACCVAHVFSDVGTAG